MDILPLTTHRFTALVVRVILWPRAVLLLAEDAGSGTPVLVCPSCQEMAFTRPLPVSRRNGPHLRQSRIGRTRPRSVLVQPASSLSPGSNHPRPFARGFPCETEDPARGGPASRLASVRLPFALARAQCLSTSPVTVHTGKQCHPVQIALTITT